MKTGMTWINAVKRGRRISVQRNRWLSVFTVTSFINRYNTQYVISSLSPQLRSVSAWEASVTLRIYLVLPISSNTVRWLTARGHLFYSYLFISFIFTLLFFQWCSWAVRSIRTKMALMLSWKNTEEVTTPPRTASGPSSNLMFRGNASRKHWIGELNIQLSITYSFILEWTAPLKTCTCIICPQVGAVFHLPPDDSQCSWQGGGGRR